MQEIDIHKLTGHHTNMVELMDVVEQPDCVSLILTYCGGGQLYSDDDLTVRFAENETAKVVCSILEVLAHLHRHGE